MVKIEGTLQDTDSRMKNVNITVQEHGDLVVDIADAVRLNDLVDAVVESLPDVCAYQRLETYDTDKALFMVYAMGNASELYRCTMECPLPVKGVFVRTMQVEHRDGRQLQPYEAEEMARNIEMLEPAEKGRGEKLLRRYCSQDR